MKETLKVKLNLQFTLELPKEYDELGQLKHLSAHVSPWLDDIFTDMRVAQMSVRNGDLLDKFKNGDSELFGQLWDRYDDEKMDEFLKENDIRRAKNDVFWEAYRKTKIT